MRPSIKPLKLTLLGLTSLFLMTLLASCVTIPAPPEQYLADCSLTYLTKEAPTTADVARIALAREYDLRLCNADKRALRSWYDGYEKACGWRCKVEK